MSKTRLSKRIILSYITIRGPDIESIYEATRVKSTATIEELSSLFAIMDMSAQSEQVGQLNDCVSFLVNVGLLKANKAGTKVSPTPNLGENPFKLILLEKLKSGTDNPFSRVHSLLVEYDDLRVSLNGLKSSVEKRIDLGFTWTDEKLDFWLDLADYIGLISKFKGHRSFAFYPKPKLVYDIILCHKDAKAQELNLRALLEYCSSKFFDCFTPEGKIFRGLQQSFLHLEREGLIKLIPAASDDPTRIRIAEKPYGSISVQRED